ncbi:MAG: helix-turn-helix domain-containing protein [Actinomycetota bacterium]
MNASRMLRAARRRAGLSQRTLSQRTGVPQSTIGRIETGAIDPRASTLDRLLRACGSELDSLPLLGVGVDRTLIHANLERSPRERLRYMAAAAENVAPLRGILRKPRATS